MRETSSRIVAIVENEIHQLPFGWASRDITTSRRQTSAELTPSLFLSPKIGEKIEEKFDRRSGRSEIESFSERKSSRFQSIRTR